MTVCMSTTCEKYSDCAKAAINNWGTHTATDKANMSFVKTDSSGKYVEEYWCGKRGEYRLFEPKTTTRR